MSKSKIFWGVDRLEIYVLLWTITEFYLCVTWTLTLAEPSTMYQICFEDVTSRQHTEFSVAHLVHISGLTGGKK